MMVIRERVVAYKFINHKFAKWKYKLSDSDIRDGKLIKFDDRYGWNSYFNEIEYFEIDIKYLCLWKWGLKEGAKIMMKDH